MRKFLLLTAFFTFFLLIAPEYLHAIDLDNHEIQQYIYNLQSAGPPRQFHDAIVFSQERSEYTRYIGIAFAHEQYGPIHVFHKNRHGIFIFVYPLTRIPESIETLYYRIVSDGVWTHDPMVLQHARDDHGLRISRLQVSREEQRRMLVTRALGNGYVEFFVNAPAESTVFVMGTFNRWNPFLHQMRQYREGLYTLRLKISPGYHAYTFVIDGRTVDTGTIDAQPDDRVFVRSLGNNALRILVE